MDNDHKNSNSNEIFPIQSLAKINFPGNQKMVSFYIIDVILILAIAFIAIFVLPKVGKTAKSSTQSTQTQNSTKQTNNLGVPSPINNPLNNNGSINSQVQYCSNPINAELVC